MNTKSGVYMRQWGMFSCVRGETLLSSESELISGNVSLMFHKLNIYVAFRHQTNPNLLLNRMCFSAPTFMTVLQSEPGFLNSADCHFINCNQQVHRQRYSITCINTCDLEPKSRIQKKKILLMNGQLTVRFNACNRQSMCLF